MKRQHVINPTTRENPSPTRVRVERGRGIRGGFRNGEKQVPMRISTRTKDPVSNAIGHSSSEPTDIVDTIPASMTKESVLVVAPTPKKMGHPMENAKITLNLFDSKKIVFTEDVIVPEKMVNTFRVIWFFGHGKNNYDKLEIELSDNTLYNMRNFFRDNPHVTNTDFVFDVCFSSALLIDYDFIRNMCGRNIRLYTAGFKTELNTKRGSFLSYSLDSIQKIVGNVFMLTVKQVNCWFHVICDMCGYRMYCYGEDRSVVNPTAEENELAVRLIAPYIVEFFSGSKVRVSVPKYAIAPSKDSAAFGIRANAKNK